MLIIEGAIDVILGIRCAVLGFTILHSSRRVLFIIRVGGASDKIKGGRCDTRQIL
jgi:hypothetical protein